MEANQYLEVSNDEILTSYIEYKELEISDFENFDTKKDLIDAGNKYLSEIANNYIDLNESNTVVINSSVGQGKSMLAVDIAKDYYLQKNENGDYKYTVIFAVPYKTLVEQYIEKINNKIVETGNHVNIPDYANLVRGKDENENQNNVRNASLSRMHVLTVNCLLSNPGDDAIEQNLEKRDYLKRIINRCVDNKRKVVIIFDEIHDAIHIFQQEFIFYLWRFKTRNILHKAFILSATFNEASKVIIKYIAELTDKKLQIFETKRIQQESNTSNLHIHLTKNSSCGYDFDSPEYLDLFGKIIDKHQNLNILSFSQNLCTNIAKGENGESIRDNLLKKYQEINICIAEENHPTRKKKNGVIPTSITFSNQYIPGMCNIGTTFKTGISIEEENSGLVIILPPTISMQGFVKSGNFGIFTNGTISLIQSIARVRKKSDIYVIMPFPKQCIREYNSYYSPPEDYAWQISKNEFLKHYLLIDYSSNVYFHHLYTNQYGLISKKYDEIKERIKKEIEKVESIEGERNEERLPFLKYPTLDMFILEKGEKYLYSTFAIFGKDLPAYMIWAAFNNQFINCKLKTLSSTKNKEPEKIEYVLEFLCNYFGNSYGTFCFAPDYDIYNSLYNRITSEYELFIKNKNGEFRPLYDYLLRRYIMTFVQIVLKVNSKLYDIYFQKDSFGHIIDKPFEAKDYLLCCMANSIRYNNEELINNSSDNSLIDSYKRLYNEVKQLFKDKFIIKSRDGKDYIFPKYDSYANVLTPNEESIFISVIQSICEKDNEFKHFRQFQKGYDMTSIYNLLKSTFFNTIEEARPTIDGQRTRIEYVDEIKLPQKRTGLNLLYKYKYNWDDNYDEEVLKEFRASEPGYEETITLIDGDDFTEEDYGFTEEYEI